MDVGYSLLIVTQISQLQTITNSKPTSSIISQKKRCSTGTPFYQFDLY